MATSLNGWTLLDYVPVTRPGPDNLNDSGFASTDVGDCLTYVMWQWHVRIEYVTTWGGGRTVAYNKKIKGHPRSNHPSFTAEDINYHLHPYEYNMQGAYYDGFTNAELKALRQILAEVGCLRWGGDFEVGRRDAQHVEIAPGTSAATVKRCADKIRKVFIPPRDTEECRAWQRVVGVKDDGLPGPGTVTATRALQKRLGVRQTGLLDEATKKAINAGPKWQTTTHIKRVQTLLNEVTDAGLVVDGIWGKKLTAATVAYQETNQLTVDGSPGPNTLKALEADMTAITDLAESIATMGERLEHRASEAERIARINGAKLNDLRLDDLARDAEIDALQKGLADLAAAKGVVDVDKLVAKMRETFNESLKTVKADVKLSVEAV